MRKYSSFLVTVIFLSVHSFACIAQSTAEGKVDVMVFLGTDCPISQAYIGVVNKLKNQYPNVRFTGVLPSANNREKKLFMKEYQVEFDLSVDKRKQLVTRYDITVTPEVVLLDAKKKVCYKGAIDNWYYELGHHRPAATEHYLRNAIEEVLAGRDVVLSSTIPIGCILSRIK